MKILVIPTTDWIYHPVPNRLNFIFDILAREHDVFVIHFRLKKFRGITPRKTNCKLIETGYFSFNDPSVYYIMNSPIHMIQILDACHKNEIDVILSANILPSFLANFTGVPVVFDYLDHIEESASIYYPDSFRGKIIRKFTRIITRFNLNRASEVITVSSDFEDYLHDIGLENITAIPNGVDTDILVPLPREDSKVALDLSGKNVIGYIGSLEHWVDLETVITGLTELDATLLVVGPGLFTDYGEKLRDLADKYGVSDRVIFTGRVDFNNLNRYISAMDIGLNPLKHMEKNELTIGGKVFNYLSCGVPVLSSRMAALERFFGNDLNYYDSREDFVSQARIMLEEPDNTGKLRAIAQQYDWKNLAGKYEEVLKKSAFSKK